MKKMFIASLLLMNGFLAMAQEPASAQKGVMYGESITSEGAVPASQLETKMKAASYVGKAYGKVVSVCQEKGCWMKIERQNGETMMVKFKDYGFFMPRDIVGKDVVIDGEAAIKEVSVKQLKHYAGDAGKSKEEISKITTTKKELTFIAKGVLVL